MNARSSVSTPLSIQPRPSSCGVARSASVQAKRLLAKSTSSSSRPASIRVMYSACSPNGSTPIPWVASQIASQVGSAFSALTQTS